MNIDQWFYQLNLAYEEKGMQISPEKKAFLLSDFPDTTTYAQKQMIGEFLDVMTQFFYKKASHGEVFGKLSRIKERFGNSIEENYGISSGPFVDFAKTYWTYKLEVGDLYPNFLTLVLSKILKEIEMDIASVFFPTPGPVEIPVSQRKKMQRKLLQEFASDIDIERFLSESPILGAKSGRVSHKMQLLSKELERYCYDHIHKLAIVYEAALTSRMEYEVGFFHVMDALNVPRSEQEKMLSTIQYSSEMQSIPYHKLSPVNQFIMAVSPYIWYCLETHPPGTMTPEEVDRITNDIEFTRYINQLAKKISQQVKGALWKPGAGCLGKATLILFAGIIIPLVVFLLFKILF